MLTQAVAAPPHFSSPSSSAAALAAAHATAVVPHVHVPRLRRRKMPSSNASEFRHLRSASLNISPQNGQSASVIGPMPGTAAAAAAAAGRFDGPRSPPNTSHVPCKFFRQGACQAGSACPFSHDLGAAAENVCKYFAKGNCKFGPKCANIHVLPDGRRINYSKNGVTIGASPIALGGRVQPPASGFPSASALTTSLFRADNVPPYSPTYPYGEERQHHLGRQPSLENGLPTIDMPYSHPGSNFGSPRDEDSNRFGFGLSPVNPKGLSVLDAPLPASFDSNGISNAARYPAAPWPSSVPSKFGLESPSPSLNSAKESRTSETLKLLYTSAFGSSDHLSSTVGPSSSPPNQLGTNGEEYFGKRAMHSSRYAKPKMLSSSLPKPGTVDRDWEAEFAFLEEDYVPQNLEDLLTPAEKARRGSLRAEGDLLDSGPKYGSPVMAASPSRWGPLFQRHKEEEEGSRASRHAPSAFGHVGSPLRNSSLAHEMSVNLTGAARPSSGSRSGSEPMSVLTQQLQRTRIGDESGNSPHLHPSAAAGRIPSLQGMSAVGKERERVIERHVSSGSIGSSVTGRFTTPIDEEDPAFVFSMEEEDEQHMTRQRKRGSAGLGVAGWSYAGVAAGKSGNASSAKESSVVVESVGGR